MYPKLVALDTDWTIFWGWLDVNTWGKGAGAYVPPEDNITKVNYWDIEDRTNNNHKCGMYADVPGIIQDILKHGAKLAIVSRNKSKPMCDRALWYWHVKDAHGNDRSFIDLVDFDEVYDMDKTNHFRRIKGWTNFDYSDMILFDDEAINNTVEMMLGVTFKVSRDQKGLTWDNYREGIEMWRRNKHIHSPWKGLSLGNYPKAKLIGYSGMDLETIKLLEAGGRRHDRKEAARWGYAMYVADNPLIAKYFQEWIKRTAFGPQSQTIVCAIYARDGDIFDRMNKIWVPDVGRLKIDVSSGNDFKIAWSQEDRDRTVSQWGVQKPYILFSRHPNMGSHLGMQFPIPGNLRWNEMVVYPQVQENLILVTRMTDWQVVRAKKLHYEQEIRSWNIAVPDATRQDFAQHNEHFV